MYNIDINKGIEEPFDVNNLTELKRFVQGVTKFNFNASKIISISTLNPSDPALCFNWTINLQYTFAALSHIESLLVMDSTFCQTDQINVTNVTNENPTFVMNYLVGFILMSVSTIVKSQKEDVRRR